MQAGSSMSFFTVLGLLISVLKRLLFEDYNSSNKIFNFFNLKDVNKSNLSVILEKSFIIALLKILFILVIALLLINLKCIVKLKL